MKKAFLKILNKHLVPIDESPEKYEDALKYLESLDYSLESKQIDEFRYRVNGNKIRIEARFCGSLSEGGKQDWFNYLYKNDDEGSMLENMEFFLKLVKDENKFNEIRNTINDGTIMIDDNNFLFSLKEAIGRPEIDFSTDALINEALKHYPKINPLEFEAEKSLGGVAEALRFIINMDARINYIETREYMVLSGSLTNDAEFGVKINVEKREHAEKSIRAKGRLENYLVKTIKKIIPKIMKTMQNA